MARFKNFEVSVSHRGVDVVGLEGEGRIFIEHEFFADLVKLMVELDRRYRRDRIRLADVEYHSDVSGGGVGG